MCGITGFWGGHLGRDDGEPVVRDMVAALVHRGPDDLGSWWDPAHQIGLGHRRLSIVDLSPCGHQPMISPSGRYVMAFNGEIYNFRDLRVELEGLGATFRGHADTEVLLAAIEEWGLRPALEKATGMFALALWDRERAQLQLVRDRVGEKPLYYGWMGDVLLFGSELKALVRHPAWNGEVNRDALALMLRHNYIPAPYSIYTGIHKLLPGTILTVADAGAGEGVQQTYWSAATMAERGVATGFTGSDTEAVDELERLLRASIRRQMVADVPLGAFLSGGFDSSTVVALMQAEATRPVQTYSIGFAETGFDEAPHARAVANHLGCEHTEMYVGPDDALAVIPTLPTLFDEPFADSSQVPTYLLAALTRKHVTVSLSGDGGDELFSGYTRYAQGHSLWRGVGWMPRPLQRAAAALLTAVPVAGWNRMAALAQPLIPGAREWRPPGDRLHKLAEILGTGSLERLYRNLVSHWQFPTDVVLGATEPATALTDPGRQARLSGVRERMMFLDLISYLPDDILTKVDRATMAVGLEARVPFLDHKVVEFAWRLPMSMKVRDGQGKWIVRQVLHRHVPPALVERPKMGFGVPIEHWLRGPLREWGEDLLSPQRLRDEGFFDVDAVRTKWQEHQAGTRQWHYYLWDVLMFQAWHQTWCQRP